MTTMNSSHQKTARYGLINPFYSAQFPLESEKPACPRVLTIAGTDPSGGAGIQADLKSITVAGGYAMGVVTALVAQNTCGVNAIELPPARIISLQLDALSTDVTIDAVKIGMLANVDYIEAVRNWLEAQQIPIVVIDPVMVATSKDRLLDPEAEQALIDLLPLATIITPNTPELEVLAQYPADSITSYEQAQAASLDVAEKYGVGVIIKGGHLKDDQIVNAYIDDHGIYTTQTYRSSSSSTHGTGCSMSSALATRLALGDTPERALEWVTSWLSDAIEAGESLKIGKGHGPADHSWQTRRLVKAASSAPGIHTYFDREKLENPDQGNQLVERIYGDYEFTEPQLQGTGPWTKLCWSAISPIVDAIYRMPFIQHLAAGTLSARNFTFYLRQDSLYLEKYQRFLSYLGALATAQDQKMFWSTSASQSIEVEKEMQRDWLSQDRSEAANEVANLSITPITSGYTDFLFARAGFDGYVPAVGAALPCPWMYMEIGLWLFRYQRADHPYRAWLEMYSDPEMIAYSTQGIQILEDEMAHASPTDRAGALRAFVEAAQWEYHFFDQAYRYDCVI